MAYTILELPSIPRDRDKLKNLIAKERDRMQKSKIMRWLAVTFFVMGCGILALNGCAGPAEGVESTSVYSVLLPIVAN